MFWTTQYVCERVWTRLDKAVENWPEDIPTLEELKDFREQLTDEFTFVEEQISYFQSSSSEALNHLDSIIFCMENGEVPEQDELEELSYELSEADRYKEV